VGVSTFAISEAIDRKMKDQFNSVNNVPQFSPLAGRPLEAFNQGAKIEFQLKVTNTTSDQKKYFRMVGIRNPMNLENLVW
jgi:hypothetical protein